MMQKSMLHRRISERPRQEMLRLHENGSRGDPGPESETLTPLAASARVAGSAPRHAVFRFDALRSDLATGKRAG